jgi:murein hydrolase activator
MRRAVPLAILGAAAALVIAGPAAGQRSGDLADKERTLQQTQRQLREERAKAADARRREAGLLTQLEEIDRELAQKRRHIRLLDGRIRRAQAEIRDLEAEIGRLEARRAGQQEMLGRRLRALYKLHVQGGVLPQVLSGEDPVAQAVRLRHLTTLATVDARAIREYRLTTEGLEDRKHRVERRRGELAGLRGEAERERAEADREADRRRMLLAKVREEREYHDRVVGELSQATRQLEAFIRELQAKQRRVVKAPSTTRARPVPDDVPPGVAFGTLRGRLLWPVDGPVVGEFGPQVHPRFGTKTFRNGIDIAATEGVEVLAVHRGQVVYAGWFRGYGNLIIVDHGSEFFTLYAHVADIQVAEGDEVKPGQSIGTVGDTGSLQGPRLHFEVRYQGKPQDPAQWLRPRG